MQASTRKKLLSGATVLAIIALDQWSKFEIRTTPALQHKDIISGWLAFFYTQNPGMAFGLDWLPTPVIGLISLTAIVGIVIYTLRVAKYTTTGHMICMGMIIGGATGNFIDRMFMGIIQGYGGFMQGNVVDFIHFTMTIHGDAVFPYIFNMADASITTSIIILLLFYRSLIPSHEAAGQQTSGDENLSVNESADQVDSSSSGIGIDTFSNPH